MGENLSVNKIIYAKRSQFSNYYDVIFEGDQFPEQIELFLPDYENVYTYSIALDTIPDSVHSIFIPKKVESITFSEKPNSLEKVCVEEGNRYLWTDGDALYSKNRKKLLCIVNHRMGSYAINPDTIEIEERCFNGLLNLEEVQLPKNLGEFSLGPWIKRCNMLTSLSIDPDNTVYSTDGHAIFSKDHCVMYSLVCVQGDEYVIPEGVERISSIDEMRPQNVKRIVFSSTVKDVTNFWPGKDPNADVFYIPDSNPYLSYDGSAFYSKDKSILYRMVRLTESFVVPSSVKTIWKYAFSGHNELKQVILPEGLLEIQEYAFRRCFGLRSIGWGSECKDCVFCFPPSLEQIGNYLFYDNIFNRGIGIKLQEIFVQSNIQKIGEGALAGLKIEELIILGKPELGSNLFKDSEVVSAYIPQLSPAKVPAKLKEKAAYSYAKRSLAGDLLCTPDEKAYNAYFKRTAKKICADAIKNEVIVRYMLGKQMIDELLIDDVIAQVGTTDLVEYRAILLDYSKRFKSTGLDRMEKMIDKEIKASEKKAKKVKTKEEYLALPLSERVLTKFKLNPQEKVELLEEAVIWGTKDDIQNLYHLYSDYEFTARALGYAIRFRDREIVNLLVNNGASFGYKDTPTFKKKYNCKVKVSNSYSYLVDYSIMALDGEVNEKYIPNGNSKEISPLVERLSGLELICKQKQSAEGMAALKKLLYEAILCRQFEVADILIKNDINALTYYLAEYVVYRTNFQSMDAADGYERWQFVDKLFRESDSLRKTMEYLSHVGSGRKLYFSRPELEGRLEDICREDIFELAIDGKVDFSKIKEKELIEAFLEYGNIKGLEYAISMQWVNGKEEIEKIMKRKKIENQKVREWL